eukprot:56425-Pyramimonas_sp.AAC.1
MLFRRDIGTGHHGSHATHAGRTTEISLRMKVLDDLTSGTAQGAEDHMIATLAVRHRCRGHGVAMPR